MLLPSTNACNRNPGLCKMKKWVFFINIKERDRKRTEELGVKERVTGPKLLRHGGENNTRNIFFTILSP